jgi:hypothetical protein
MKVRYEEFDSFTIEAPPGRAVIEPEARDVARGIPIVQRFLQRRKRIEQGRLQRIGLVTSVKTRIKNSCLVLREVKSCEQAVAPDSRRKRVVVQKVPGIYLSRR